MLTVIVRKIPTTLFESAMSPIETLKTIAAFCGRRKLHLLNDEICAQSVFQNPSAPDATPFTSILAIDPRQVQVLYGPSKDFCANGLRLGVLCSRSEGLLGAVASLSVFAWPLYMIQDVWAHTLEDRDFLDGFLAEKRRLAKNYKLATSFFDEHRIRSYEGGNAAVFFWLDLRPYLLPTSHPIPPESQPLAILKTSPLSSHDLALYRAKEAQIVSTCMKNGVFIGYGSNFFTEELGWFRVTFTARKEALVEGLKRILSSLEEVEAA